MSSNLSRLEKTGILFAIAASAASISGFQLDKYFEKHADPSGVWKAESPGGMAYSKCLYVQELTDRKYNAWMLDEPQPNRNTPIFLTVDGITASFRFTTEQGWGVGEMRFDDGSWVGQYDETRASTKEMLVQARGWNWVRSQSCNQLHPDPKGLI